MPENPYNRLKRKAADLIWQLLHPKKRHVLTYTGADEWDGEIRDLFAYAHALDSVGCDVVLRVDFDEKKLRVEAVERPDETDVPHWLR